MRHITELLPRHKAPRKMKIILTQNEIQKPIKGSAVSGGASAMLTKRGSFTFMWHLWAKRHLPGDNFFMLFQRFPHAVHLPQFIYLHYTCQHKEDRCGLSTNRTGLINSVQYSSLSHKLGGTLDINSGFLHNNNLWQNKQWYLSFDSDLVEMRWSSSTIATQRAQAQAASCSWSSRESGIIWAQGHNLLTFATAAWWQSGFTSQVYVHAAAAANGVNTARKRLRECNF